MAGELMTAEIAEQPRTLQRLLDEGSGPIAEVAAWWRARRPRFVLFAARGTSDHAALYAKYLAEITCGLPAGLVSPSTTTVYHATPDLTDVLYVAVSQSGSSEDLVASVRAARVAGAHTVAVTNDPTSELAAVAETHIDVRAGTERAVAATKTYTAELLALYLLFGGDPDRAAALPAAAAATLASRAPSDVAARLRFASRLVTTGRGWSYATAREAALKLMETSYLAAQAFSGADLLHGPLAMVDGDVPVLAVASPGPGGAAMAPVFTRLAERGADVLRVGPHGDLPVVLDGVPDDLAPVVEILPLQRLAAALAVARGGDPDRPRGLAKVTSTC